MWQYGSMDERLKKREEAWQVDTWGKTVSKASPRLVHHGCWPAHAPNGHRPQTVKLCDSMDANILLPLPFSPLR